MFLAVAETHPLEQVRALVTDDEPLMPPSLAEATGEANRGRAMSKLRGRVQVLIFTIKSGFVYQVSHSDLRSCPFVAGAPRRLGLVRAELLHFDWDLVESRPFQ